MLLIHRSILRELILSLLMSVLFLNFTLMMEKLLRLSRVLAGAGTTLADIGKIILYLQPQILILTIPMSMLLSVLLTFGRMNADNELTVLKVSGLSFRSITRPVVYLGIVSFAVALIMSFYLGPLGSVLIRDKVTEILTTKAAMAVEEGIFNTAFKDVVLLVKEKPTPDHLVGIYILDERKKDDPVVITAREGKIIPGAESLGFRLTNGHIYLLGPSTTTEIIFGAYNLFLALSAEPVQRKTSEMTPLELLAAADRAPNVIHLMLEFYRRISLPAVCLIIILLGPSLSLIAGRSGKLGGLTIGLLVFVAYYTLLIYGENLARSGTIPAAVGAWLAFLILGSFSAVVFERVNRR